MKALIKLLDGRRLVACNQLEAVTNHASAQSCEPSFVRAANQSRADIARPGTALGYK